MKSENIIADKSFKFAIRVVHLSRYLVKEKNEYVISKQILRCGTSIGANIEEAIGGRTRKDFLNSFIIAYKESRETIYWLKLIYECKLINEKLFESLYEDCEELVKILSKIILTLKKNLKSE